MTAEEKADKEQTQKSIDEQKARLNETIRNYGKDNQAVHQLIDLALLQNGMLRGEALNKFVERSISLINK